MMNDPQAYLANQAIDTPFEGTSGNDLDAFIDFTPLLGSANGNKQASGNSEGTNSGPSHGRVSTFERHISDIRGENDRLRQQLRQRYGGSQGAQSSANIQNRPALFSQPQTSNLAGLTGVTEQEPFMSIGEVLDPSSLVSSTAGSQAPKAQNFGLIPEIPRDDPPRLSRNERVEDIRPKQRTYFSRPFRTSGRSATRDLSSSPHNGHDGSSESLRKTGDQKQLEGLRAELESAREEIRQLCKRCNEVETKCGENSDQVDQERDERYCEYFDWIFEFAVETFNLLKEQDVELPPKLVNVYNIICRVGT